MAVMELLKSSTRTLATPNCPQSYTSPGPQPQDHPEGERQPESQRYVRTESMVAVEERGSEELSNEAGPEELPRGTTPRRQPVDDPVGARLRSELARDLLRRVEQLVPLAGDPALAANIRLLKRDLAEAHDRLKGYPSEGNFLSLVTLIESMIAQRKWREYSADLLVRLRSVVEIGYRKPQVRFEDYDLARQQLQAARISTGPRIDLQSLSMDDIEDGEEGNAPVLS
jgi:hypothetical protein